MNIGFATSAAYPLLTNDDRPLIDCLRDAGSTGRPLVWDDPSAPWTECDAVVLRSTWDYHHRPQAFAAWLDHLDRLGVPLWNPTRLVRWNMHKRYLRDLAASGIRIPETVWLDQGDAPPLAEVLGAHGWTTAIVKPAISASATDTFLAARDSAADGARHADLLTRADVLVQEVVPEVIADGEWSLVFLGGAYSHATMKRPRAGDFRVQVELGGSAAPADAPVAVIQAARRVADGLPGPWLYARVDGVMTARGFVLMEVECIEPHLFLSHAPGAHRRFTDALARLASSR